MEKKYITTIADKYTPCRMCQHLEEGHVGGFRSCGRPGHGVDETPRPKFITNSDYTFGCDKGKLLDTNYL